MTPPLADPREYVERVATSLAALTWHDLDPRGLVVTATAGRIRAQRTFLGAGEFALSVDEDVVDPAVGGTGHGSFTAASYHGVLHRMPDQVALLIDTSKIGEPAAGGGDLETRWQPVPLPAPGLVDAEAWAEYGFERAVETAVVRAGDTPIAYGCLIPFHPGVLEAGIYVEQSVRGRGLGSVVASLLFRRLAARGLWCHWVTLAQNAASRRLAHLGRVALEVDVSTYWWE